MTLRHWLGALASLGVLGVSSAAFADPALPTRASAMATVAERLSKELAGAPPAGVVVAAPLRTDESAPRGDELVVRLGQVVGGALGASLARPEPLALPAARSAARRADAFVYVQAEVLRGELRVSADVYPSPQGFWERLLRPNPSPIRHAFASARLDAEVRGFLAPVPLVMGQIDRAKTEDRDVVALACGDLDADGALDLVTLGRRRIARGRLRGGRFETSHAIEWSALSPIAPAPLREPMAGVAILSGTWPSGAFVDVGLTDRASGMRLDRTLRPVKPIEGVPVSFGDRDVCATYAPSETTPTFARCSQDDPQLELAPLSNPTDIVTIEALTTRSAGSLAIWAARNPQTGELRLVANGFGTTIAGVGAQVAIADLDTDGIPEIISSADVLSPSEDALVVHSWRPGEAAQERARIPVPQGVRAIAVCPPEGAGASPIAVATAGAEIWVVR